MDVKALIIVGGAEAPAERVAGVPMAALDVLGRSVLHRVIDRLRAYAVSNTAVLCEPAAEVMKLCRRQVGSEIAWPVFPGMSVWRAALHWFCESARHGAELMLLLRLGPYAEIDYEPLIQFHLDRQSRVTAVCDQRGDPLDMFVISAAARKDAAALLRNKLELGKLRSSSVAYLSGAYVNRLVNAGDLRRLAVDAFAGKASLAPVGKEMKPGVWTGPGARIHRSARVLAPAFIGAHARIRAAAVVAHCSAIERHAQIDCGTVVDDASLLPYTTLGAGLEISHSVVGFKHLAHLRRAVEMEIEDPKLVGEAARGRARLLESAAALAGFVPVQFVRGLFAPRAAAPAELCEPMPPTVLPAAAPPSGDSAPEPFSAQLVVARRYGNE
jgi:hypothetical protein